MFYSIFLTMPLNVSNIESKSLCFHLSNPPIAYEYEGLTHYDLRRAPVYASNWTLPTHTMTTYDSEAVSFRAMM